ncbi:hypothetical protein [Pedobacter sp. Hv1]|uniref:hypothetical protein n=1 Tax=Pedobacter sp. Hv1 TaxID=1740090 RepID=UPI0006D8BD45|nr:hypothetical protein [Pedobacter sp. Hv1]KQB99027.1 hypothetical protein AQF98_20080 [Pedobacter sp. Hv1]
MKTDFVEIFQTIRAGLQPYTANGFTALVNSETNYELWSERKVSFEGRKEAPMYFTSVKILKGYVGFYLMSLYIEPELKAMLHPDLLKLLKGKSCFNIKRMDDTLMAQIDEALAVTFTFYKQKGWV